jgi:hypothetical protein
MNAVCLECMFLRYNVDCFTGEMDPYCNLLEEVIKQEEFEKEAPEWCPLRKKLNNQKDKL